MVAFIVPVIIVVVIDISVFVVFVFDVVGDVFVVDVVCC